MAVREAGLLLRGLMALAVAAGGASVTQTSTFQSLISGLRGEDYNATAEEGRLQVWIRGACLRVSSANGADVDTFVNGFEQPRERLDVRGQPRAHLSRMGGVGVMV